MQCGSPNRCQFTWKSDNSAPSGLKKSVETKKNKESRAEDVKAADARGS